MKNLNFLFYFFIIIMKVSFKKDYYWQQLRPSGFGFVYNVCWCISGCSHDVGVSIRHCCGWQRHSLLQVPPTFFPLFFFSLPIIDWIWMIPVGEFHCWQQCCRQWICDILVRIRIRESVPLTNGSGSKSGSVSCYFSSWPSKNYFYLLITVNGKWW